MAAVKDHAREGPRPCSGRCARCWTPPERAP